MLRPARRSACVAYPQGRRTHHHPWDESSTSFCESLTQHLPLIASTRAAYEAAGEDVVGAVSPSFLAPKEWLRRNADSIWIVSNGFVLLIVPMARKLGIRDEHVSALRQYFLCGLHRARASELVVKVVEHTYSSLSCVLHLIKGAVVNAR